MHTTSDVLENCIQIERIVGEIYAIFMNQQAACPEYAALWEKTAQEELNHEQQFILAKRLACSMKTDITDVPYPSDALVKLLREIKSRVADIPLAPSEALRVAINMEEKLAMFHLNQMRIFADESTNALFKSMMNNDNEHAETLKTAFLNVV